jgi:DNA-binding transcriptional ArsR family regulator
MSSSSPASVIDLVELSQRPMRVATDPLATVLRVATDSIGDGRPTFDPWRSAARDALRPTDLRTLAPMRRRSGGQWTLIPHCVTPPQMAFGTSIEDELDQVAATEPEVLLAELCEMPIDEEMEREWSIARNNPRRWLAAYVNAVWRVWTAVLPRWERAVPLLERELERVGTAWARGAVIELVTSLQPAWPVDGEAWRLPPMGGYPKLRIAPAGLVLVPILAGPKSRGLWEADPEEATDVITHVGYPLPGADRLCDHPRANGTSLEALIGEQRALILRRLDRPATAGEIAELIVATPSAATHHLSALERSGLAARERQGRFVMVRRTARGTALLALYE